MSNVLRLKTEYEAPVNKTFREIHEYPPIMLVEDIKEFTRLGTVRTYELLKHPKCPTIRYGRLSVYRDDFIKFYLELGAE